MIGMPGAYKNYDDLEESLSLPELQALIIGIEDKQWEEWKFAASLKGHDIGNNRESVEERIAAVEAKAAARLNGVSEQEYELASIGIELTVEEE